MAAEMDRKGLLPCPFCGGEAQSDYHKDDFENYQTVTECWTCGAGFRAHQHDTSPDNIEATQQAAWNRRTYLDASGTGAGVKGLEWESLSATYWVATTSIGAYYVEDCRHLFTGAENVRLRLPDHAVTRHETPEAAKAAAQADYERRIMSSLSAPVPETVGVDEVRHACAASGFHDHDGCSCSDDELRRRASPAEGKPFVVEQLEALIRDHRASVVEWFDTRFPENKHLHHPDRAPAEGKPVALRKAVASAISDPGVTEGYKGDRTLTEWQVDAVMRALATPTPQGGMREALERLKAFVEFVSGECFDTVVDGREHESSVFVQQVAEAESALAALTKEGT